MFHTFVASPVGRLLLVGDGHAVTGLYPDGHVRVPVAVGRPDRSALAQSSAQLEQDFAGERAEFDLALAPAGTPFQQLVWHELQRIEPGGTRSYRALALGLGRPNGARAVGLANSRNPISIIVPCHRLVGSSGDLTG